MTGCGDIFIPENFLTNGPRRGVEGRGSLIEKSVVLVLTKTLENSATGLQQTQNDRPLEKKAWNSTSWDY
jgi:hypothetical protein